MALVIGRTHGDTHAARVLLSEGVESLAEYTRHRVKGGDRGFRSRASAAQHDGGDLALESGDTTRNRYATQETRIKGIEIISYPSCVRVEHQHSG